jgi:hypothetical protein
VPLLSELLSSIVGIGAAAASTTSTSPLPLLRLGGDAAPARQRLGQLRRRRRPVAEVVQRRVADDPVEPGPQLDLRLGAAQREQRLREGVLGDVLGAAADDRRGEAVQRPPVAPHDLLEGAVVAVAHEVDEPPVRLRAQRRTEEDPGGEVLGWRRSHS